ncbi:hypothetical protein [Spirochaeta cellobiosiphila]|uniref:hypothetical protein n=1 Tax=Spirochaeta cellobiosiphila TaxID=504483 RepID=UPI0004147BD7|nr:hypothetical protein [Spirochaeta cellobiosiphila]
MVINRSYGPVADWWFEGEIIKDLFFSKEDCLTLIDKLCNAVDILLTANLLYPNQINISGWASYDPNKRKLTRQNKKDEIILISSSNVREELFSVFHPDDASPFLYPLEIEICGEGILYNKNSKPIVWSDPISVCGQTIVQHVVDVITYSYAWLPYDLKGNRQTEIYNLNAPRLEEALNQIQAQTGFHLIDESNSEYAVIDNYKLFNHRDADGEIITFKIRENADLIELHRSQWNYIFYQVNDGFLLSVTCGTVGLFEINIYLNKEETGNYKSRGIDYIEELAQKIRNSPLQYQERDVDLPVNESKS